MAGPFFVRRRRNRDDGVGNVDGADGGLFVEEPPQTELQLQLVDLGQRLIGRLRIRKRRIRGHDPTEEIDRIEVNWAA